MAEVIQVTVPDIGDFTDVPVIEVLVEPGQTVQEEDALVTLESDKATMEVPSPSDGTVAEIKIAVGDKVSEGTVVLTLEPAEGGDDPVSEQDAPVGEEDAKATPSAPAPAGPELLADADEIYASPSVRRRARDQGIDLSTVEGSGRGGRITLDDLKGSGLGTGHPMSSAETRPL